MLARELGPAAASLVALEDVDAGGSIRAKAGLASGLPAHGLAPAILALNRVGEGVEAVHLVSAEIALRGTDRLSSSSLADGAGAEARGCLVHIHTPFNRASASS
jgi:hypothetical protein